MALLGSLVSVLKAEIGVLGRLYSFLEALAKNSHPPSFRLLAEFSSMWL